MAKQIRFTEAELEIIMTMYTIAKAGPGDGDYAPWTDAEWEALETATDKVSALLRRIRDRKESQPITD